MTVLNNLDFPFAHDGFRKPELEDWMRDINRHAKLTEKYFAVMSKQTKLMEQLPQDNALYQENLFEDAPIQRVGQNRITCDYFAANLYTGGQTDTLLADLIECRKSYELNASGQIRNKSRMDVIQDILEPFGLWYGLHLPVRPQAVGHAIPNVIEVGEKGYFPFRIALNEQNSIRLIEKIDWDRTAVIFDPQMRECGLRSWQYAILRFAAEKASEIELDREQLVDAQAPTDKDQGNRVLTELKKLDAKILTIETEMAEIEGRALTFVPTDSHDAQVLLRFVASVLEFGHKIDADYLADVLAACTETIDAQETAASSKTFSDVFSI